MESPAFAHSLLLSTLPRFLGAPRSLQVSAHLPPRALLDTLKMTCPWDLRESDTP